MANGRPLLIPAGRVFSPDEIVHYAERDARTLDEAIADADIIVTAPHAGAAIPEELAEFLAPELTERLQYDFTDVSTSPVVRRWAELDPRIVVVENPHPRMIRDPNRPEPADVAASLAEALRRVREAGPYRRVDLTGVDAIRPVTFSFFPLLVVPQSDAGLQRLCDTFARVAEQGLGVYERTRDDLVERFVASGLERARRDGSASVTHFAFHDTMNRTTTREGAIDVARAPADRLPEVVALSNRGDHDGDERTPEDPATMDPDRIRRLAHAFREGFDVASPEAVALNRPYLGSFEIVHIGGRFRERAAEASAAGLVLDSVQGEFLREYLLGEANTATLMRPGTGWIEPDADRVDLLAHRCMLAWDGYRQFWE